MERPELCAVVIHKGAFGNRRAVRVTPQHGLVIETDVGPRFVRAKHIAELLGGQSGRIDRKTFVVTYVHVIFDRDALVIAEGAVCESFCPGPMTLGELLALFPELAETWAAGRSGAKTYAGPALGYLSRDAARAAFGVGAGRPVPARVASRVAIHREIALIWVQRAAGRASGFPGGQG